MDVVGLRCGLLFAVVLSACSANGPPYRDAPPGAPSKIDGNYQFSPALAFFQGARFGEIAFRQTRADQPETLFFLRVLGRDDENVIRLRQYEGRAVSVDGHIELRSERCYLFGKRAFDDRLTPLERWDCEHLLFPYAGPVEASGRIVLRPIDAERGDGSAWFQATELLALPQSSRGAAHFAGQIVARKEQESLPEDADVVVWGFEGAERLRNGNVLDAEDSAGRPAGRLRVIARVSDFVLCRWIERGAEAAVAFTVKSQIGGAGLF